MFFSYLHGSETCFYVIYQFINYYFLSQFTKYKLSSFHISQKFPAFMATAPDLARLLSYLFIPEKVPLKPRLFFFA